jgi:hypothetical protein
MGRREGVPLLGALPVDTEACLICWTVRRGGISASRSKANRVDLGWLSDIRRRQLFEKVLDTLLDTLLRRISTN